MNHIEGVSAALIKNGKILVVRRSADDNFLAGYYEMPGGKIEAAENHEQAIIREIQEELGLRIKVLKKYHQFSYRPGPNTYCTDHQYLVTLTGKESLGNLKLSHEHDEYKWVDKSELEILSPITPEAKESLRLALKA